MAKASCPRPTAPASGLLVQAIARAPGPPSAVPRNIAQNQQLEARPSRRASAFSALPASLGNTELPSRDTDETIATFGRNTRGLILAPTKIQNVSELAMTFFRPVSAAAVFAVLAFSTV